MQQFKNEKRREVDIVNMKTEEVREYYLQNLELSKQEKQNREKNLKERIKKAGKEAFEWILAIKSKDGKVIGKIEVMEIGEGKAYFRINLPNKNWKRRYGVEAAKQFVKICKENQYFSVIELEKKNSTVQRFVADYAEKYKIKDFLLEIQNVV